MKLEPYRVGRELARPALGVESNGALGRAAHVRHNEADAGIKFSGMPLDLGDNPPRLGPGSGLIAEIGMEPAHMVRRSSDWAREQIARSCWCASSGNREPGGWHARGGRARR